MEFKKSSNQNISRHHRPSPSLEPQFLNSSSVVMRFGTSFTLPFSSITASPLLMNCIRMCAAFWLLLASCYFSSSCFFREAVSRSKSSLRCSLI